jgi:TRAP-type C4-dicarboxylate transport system substrate-binding protein
MSYLSRRNYKAKVKLTTWVFLSIFLMCAYICTSNPATVQAAEKGQITLTLVSGWPIDHGGNIKLKEFVKRVNEKGKGKVFIDFKGGPEIAAMTVSPKLLRDGVFDLASTTPGYYAGLCPVSVTGYYVPSDPVLLRKIGYYDLMDEVHRKKMGCAFLGQLWRGEKFVILSKKPITSADFSGWKMHSIPIFTAGLKKLGAATVALALPEFYTALERGVVDAIPLPMGMVPLDAKLYEVSKYILHPPIPITTSNSFLANAKRWDSLPADVKKLITDTVIALEPEVYDFYSKIMYTAEAELVKKGMEITELPPEEAKKYYYAFTEHTWGIFTKKFPEYGPKVYEMVKPYLKY